MNDFYIALLGAAQHYQKKLRARIGLKKLNVDSKYVIVGLGLLALVVLPFATSITQADSFNNSVCFGVSAPSSLMAGQTFTAHIGMTNTGTQTWMMSDATPHRLGSQNPQDNTRWGTSRINLPSDIVPGGSATFTSTFTAPMQAGTYSFDWQMVEESVGWFGATCTWTIRVDGQSQQQGAPNAATLSPASVTQTSVVFQGTVNPNNAPTNAWFEYGTSPSLGGLVGAQTLGSSGSSMNFSFSFNQLQPNTTYYYRTVAQNTFGTTQGNVVSFNTGGGGTSGLNNASCVSVDAPSLVSQGQAFTARVTMRNTGTQTWMVDSTPHRLQSQSPQDNTRWGISRVELPFNVFSGNTATFQFTAIAPWQTGTYPFDWRMIEESVESFGEICTRTIVVTSQGGGINVPSVLTLSASSISQTSALLQGAVNPNGSHTNAWFEYGTTPSLGSVAGRQSMGSGTAQQSFFFAISNLQPNTTYYYRAVAENSFGTSQGNTLSFMTQFGQQGNMPLVTTNAASNIIQTSATLVGMVNPNNSSTNAWFEYGTTPSLGSTIGFQFVGSGWVQSSVSQNLSGLQPNTVYYYRIAAQNSFGTSRGNILSFVTQTGGANQGGAPFTVSLAPSAVFRNGAVIRGSTNPNGSMTSAWFEWGRTQSLGFSTPAQSTGNGTTLLDYSAPLSGLRTNTTYYYRAAAQNNQGVQRGIIRSFTTPKDPVPVPTPTPTPTPQPTPTPPQATPGPSASLISLTPSVDKNNPRPNDTVTLTIAYRNDNDMPLQDAVVRVTLPRETTYQSASIAPSTQTTETATFMLGAIPQKSQGTLTMQAKIGKDVSAGETLVFNTLLEYRSQDRQIASVGSFVALTAQAKETDAAASAFEAFGGRRWAFAFLVMLVLILLAVYLFVQLNREREARERIEYARRTTVPPAAPGM